MTRQFGGLGGVSATIPLDELSDDLFVMAMNRALGDKMRADEETCIAMWSALANQDWKHENGDTAGYSFRAAGDVIAAIRGEGDYLDWYCSGEYAVVRDDIREALAKEGWTPIDNDDA